MKDSSRSTTHNQSYQRHFSGFSKFLQQSPFDDLVQRIVDSDPGTYFVVDNGSPSFIPMMSYLVENGVFDLLTESKHRVIINTVIAGGPDVQETVHCFQGMMDQTTADALVWFNAYFGPLKYQDQDADTRLLQQYGDRLIGTVTLQKLMEQTYGQDVREMLEKRLTFDEAIQQFNLMPGTRIKRLKEKLWAQLTPIFAGETVGGKRRAKKASN